MVGLICDLSDRDLLLSQPFLYILTTSRRENVHEHPPVLVVIQGQCLIQASFQYVQKKRTALETKPNNYNRNSKK